MPATPITDPFPGEDLIGVEPQLLQQVDPGWRHRLALFVGRALSDTALDSEQLYRAGLLAMLGQVVSPGVVKGLAAAFELAGTATTTTAKIAAGNSVSIAIADSTGFQTGQQAVIDTGANQEQFKVVAIADRTHITADKLAKAHDQGVSVQFEPLMNASAGAGASTVTSAAVTRPAIPMTVDNSAGFQAGQPAVIDGGINQESFQVTAVPDATHITANALIRNHDTGTSIVQTRAGTTTTSNISPGGQVSIAVADSSGFKAGQQGVIDTGAAQEQFTVAAVPDATHIVANALGRSHSSGSTIAPASIAKITAPVTLAGVSIAIADSTGFQLGQPARIDTGDKQEQFTVVAIADATHITADVLVRDHASGVPVVFEPVLSVTAGYGISASGEDVLLQRDLKTKLSSVTVIDLAVEDLVSGNTQLAFADYTKLASSNTFVGVLLLQPVVAQGTAATLARGDEPLIVSGNLDASCDQDPDENAFADLQIVDATRLVFVPWPASLPLPAQSPPETWRNRLAYTVFNAEMNLDPDDQLPWSMLGVPVALVAFDSSWKPLFLDNAAVVRQGGLPRRNYVLPTGADELPTRARPELLQARVTQLSEHLSERLTGAAPFRNLSDILSTAPPSGVVPAAALDFVNKKNVWFPPNWDVTVGPVHLEELETVLQTGITASALPVQAAAPTDKTQLEPVEVLVPLPDELYDPKILITETVSEEFQAEIDLATGDRNRTLKKRKVLQLEANTLISVLGPNVPPPNPNLIRLNDGLTQEEITARDSGLPYMPVVSGNTARDESFGVTGPATWQANNAFIVGQFIVDGNRNLQVAQKIATSANTEPTWNTGFGGITSEAPTNVTNLTAAVAAGSNVAITVSGSAGFQPGMQLLIDTGANQEQFTVVAITDASHITADRLTKPHAAGVFVVSNANWINNGPVTLGSPTWQASSSYLAGQFVLDPNGNLQTAQVAGISGASDPLWQTNPGATTVDGGMKWTNGGPGRWQANRPYKAGQFVIDPKGNTQTVQADGTSGSTQPTWQSGFGAITPDASIKWLNNGQSTWQKQAAYGVRQFIVDHNGNLEIVTAAGTSGNAPPQWATGLGQTTQDGNVTWTNAGAGRWQANTAFIAGQFIFDRNGNVQVVQTAGTSGATEPQWSTTPGQPTADNQVKWVVVNWNSSDMQGILRYPGAFTGSQFPLCTSTDQQDLTNNGLQHFIDHMNAKISKADDLINLAFVTAQTDIYRYRQYVLGATSASRLATSPILANIATGDTASVVSENLQTFLNSIPSSKSAPFPTPAPPTAGGAPGVSLPPRTIGLRTGILAAPVRTMAPATFRATPAFTTMATRPATEMTFVGAPAAAPATQMTLAGPGAIRMGGVQRIDGGAAPPPTIFKPVQRGTGAIAASVSDVTQQQPLVGAQLNIRTLTVAERLAQSPPQEALFYSVSNRLAFLQLLIDLDLTIEDLPIFVDSAAPSNTNPDPVEPHTLAELRNPSQRDALLNKVQGVQIQQNSDEATVFSNGIRVLEQHSQVLRALEGRVQQYRDFVSFCSTALANIQNNLQRAVAAITKLDNNLLQDRQNVSFTSQLLAEEIQRVNVINAKRLQTLQNSVQVVAYTRARTLEATATTPTRQLVPGNVTSPVPACLQETMSIPPELREIVALLREAPVSWLPAVQALLTRLERPELLYGLAVSMQNRAVLQMQLPQQASSADTEAGVYAPVISSLYYTHQQVFRTFTTQRSAFPLGTLANQSWQSLVGTLQGVVAVGDLIGSSMVHAEIVNATSRLVTQISNVATCLYTRISATDPQLRLAWAEFLRGPGLSLRLQSLAVLPNWSQQEYVARDQMQMLADWLYQQIDNTNSAAVAFMSDVVRVAILLASHAPVDQIISSALTVRTQPIIGGGIVLHLPVERVATGMYVNLYSKGVLAAQAVVNDQDTQTVKATVTNVYQSGVFIETTDVVHFTAQTPKALALRALAS